MDGSIGAGARPRHRGGRGRGPNPPNNPQLGGQEPERRQQRQQQPNLGEFGDMSVILKEWRDVVGIIGPVLKQRAAICWAIVLARLVEAAHNISIGNSTRSLIQISISDLVNKVKKDTKDMEILSFKKVFKLLKKDGIAKKSPTSVQNDVKAPKITWNFGSEENADMTFIATKLESSPVGIVLEIDDEFKALQQGIYNVRRAQPDSFGKIERHALLITGRGRTPNGREFLIAQNSWDTVWGVNGYGRITLEDGMRCLAFYPETV